MAVEDSHSIPPVLAAAAHEDHRLTDIEPELASRLGADELALTRRLRLATVHVEPGARFPFELFQEALAAIVVEGRIVREEELAGRTHLQLVGPGDLLDPRGLTGEAGAWRVLATCSIAILDHRIVQIARRCPDVMVWLTERLFDGHREQQVLAAVRILPRVEERLLELLTHAASRWGTVTPAGLALFLPITHQDLGRLVGARRPTVSLALKELDEHQLLRRLHDGRWFIPNRGAGSKGQEAGVFAPVVRIA